MTDLSSLIKRLEEAEGPSRELDARIHAALFPDEKFMSYGGDVRTNAPPKYERLRKFNFDTWTGGDWDGVAGILGAREKYTASVDAAISLAKRVLPGWDWGVQGLGEDGSYGKVWEHGWHDDTVVFAEHAHPAMALVLATLRAIQSKGEQPCTSQT